MHVKKYYHSRKIQAIYKDAMTDLIVVGEEEVDVVGEPANTKHYQHNYEHLGKLKL